MENYFRCCICGYRVGGYGNNPWPVSIEPDARCCDKCNSTVVIPARLDLMQRKNDGTEQS